MSAQTDFIKGMHGFRLARKHGDLIEKAPSEQDHNLRSKAFRNGLAIIGFSVLEHFIRTRTGELMNSFDQIPIPFEDLPDRIKKPATSGAISGIRARLKYSDDPISFSLGESTILSSALSTRYQLSKYSIGWERSNLSIDDIDSIFKFFHIETGWVAINDISSRLNLTIPSPKAAYDNAAKRRNNAAHNIDAEIHPLHLESFVREAYGIAIGFDILISTAYNKIYKVDNNYLNNNVKVNTRDIGLRVIKLVNNQWKEYREGKHRAIKVATSAELLWPLALARALRHGEFLCCMDNKGFPSSWKFPSIPV